MIKQHLGIMKHK